MKSITLGRMKILPSLLLGALLIGTASTVLAAGPRLALLAPGFSGDTTADAVLGQLSFIYNDLNLVDGSGLYTAPAQVGDVAIDKTVTPNRVYVVDRGNNRVLGWKDIAAFATHAAADIVIGQPDFSSNVCNYHGVTAASLCNPSGVATDQAGNLYVADTSNHRVLFYTAPFTNDAVADDVFGQFSSFTTNYCNGFGLNQDTLCNPARVALDTANNLYVSDQSNNRVLEFNTPEAITSVEGSGDVTADRVFGQFGSFTTNSANNAGISANSLYNPIGLTFDATGNLYVADFYNNRVLKFNAPLSTDTVADKVYGQSNVFTTNTCNKGGILNQTSLCNPIAVAVDPQGRLFVSDRGNHRILGYYSTSGSTTASIELGQFGSFNINLCNNTGGGTYAPGANSRSLCYPDGLAFDNNAVAPNSPNLYASDSNNNRVLQYKPSAISTLDPTLIIKNGQSASGIIGQSLLTTNSPNSLDGRGFGMSLGNQGMVAIDRTVVPNRIYVSDPNNNRVLAWSNVAAFTTHAPATLVFGQPNPFTNVANNGGISNKSLNNPRGVAVDSHGNLYVSDQSNNRILEYNTPFSSGTGADRVFGQSGFFTTNVANQPGLNANGLYAPMGLALDASDSLYVADFYNNRVLRYLTPLTSTVATKVYGQAGSFTTNSCNLGGLTANSLCNPTSVAIDSSGNVYVADYNNNRVLEFNSLPATDTTADFVFGQGNNFTTNTCNLGALTAASLCQPRAVTITSGGNVLIADTNNHRVLKYTTPLTTDRTADRVFGQGNLFTINGCKTLGPASLCWPEGIAIDGSNNLYIVDSNNNRVLQFLNP